MNNLTQTNPDPQPGWPELPEEEPYNIGEEYLAEERAGENERLRSLYLDEKEFAKLSADPRIREGSKVSLVGDELPKLALNAAYLSHRLGRDISANDYQFERDRYAANFFGQEKVNDGQFFDLVKGEFKFEEDRRLALNGLRMKVISRALADAVSGQRTPVAEPYQEWVRESGGLFEGNESEKFLAGSIDLYGRTWQEVGKYAHLAGPGLDLLKRFTAGESTEDDLRGFASTLAGVPEEDRNKVLAFMAMGAEAGQVDRDGLRQFARNMGQVISRGFNFGPQFVAQGEELSLLELRDVLETGDVWLRGSGEAALYNVQRPGNTRTVNGVGLIDLRGRKATSEEIEKLKTDTEGALTMVQIVRELRNVADNEVDPITRVFDPGTVAGTLEGGVLGVAGSLPMMAATAVNPLVGLAAYQSFHYNRLRIEAPEMPPRAAAGLATIEGTWEAALDRVQLRTLQGALPSTGRLLGRIKNNGLRRTIKFAASSGEQFGQELAQDIGTLAIDSVAAALREDMPDKNFLGELGNYWQQAPELAVASILFGVVGGGFASTRDIRLTDEMAQLAGLSAEARTRMTLATTPEELDAVIAAEWKNRRPEYMAEARQAAERMISLAKDQQADPLRPTLEVERTGDGPAAYRVVRPDGTELLRTASPEAARLAMADYLEASIPQQNDPMSRPRVEQDGAEFIVRDVDGLEVMRTPDQDAAAFELGKLLEGRKLQFYEAQVAMVDLLTKAKERQGLSPQQSRIEIVSQAEIDALAQITPEQLVERVRQYEIEFGQAPAGPVSIAGVNVAELRDQMLVDVSLVRRAADPLVAVEEVAEGALKRAWSDGRFTVGETAAMLREYEAFSGETLLKDETDPADILEAASTFAVGHFMGKKNVAVLPPRLRAFLDWLGQYIRAVMARATKIEQFITEGRGNESIISYLSESLGMDPDTMLEERTARQTADLLGVPTQSLALRPEEFAADVRLDAQGNVVERPAGAYDALQSALAELDANPVYRRERLASARERFEEIRSRFFSDPDWSPLDQIEAVALMESMVSIMPADARGKIGGFRKLTEYKTTKGRANYLLGRIAKIDQSLEEYFRKEYDEDARRLFKRSRPQRSKPGEKPRGKIGTEPHALFKTLEGATQWSQEKATGYVAGLWQEIESGELTPEKEAHVILEAQAIPLFADWKNADAAQRGAAVALGQEILNRAYKAERAKAEQRRTRNADLRAELNKGAGVAGDEKARMARLARDNGAAAWAEKQLLGLVNFDQALTYLFGDNTPAVRRLSDAQRRADNAKSDGIAEKSDQWALFLNKLAGGSMAGQELVFALSQKTEKVRGIEFSQLEMAAVSMMWMQDKGRAHMIGPVDKKTGQPTGSWNYDQAFVSGVEARLRPETVAIRDYLLARYEEEYQAINRIYRRVYGLDLPRNKFYSPLVVDAIMPQASAGIDPVTGALFAQGSRTPPALSSRGARIAQPRFRNVLQTYFAHTMQMEHWKAYAEFNAEAAAVLAHRDVRNVVEAKAGPQGVEVLTKWLNFFAAGGNREAASNLAITTMLNNWLGRASSMALFGRLSTLALQSTQLAAASAKMPMGAYILRLSKLFAGQLGWREAFKSPYIRRRIKELPPQVRIAMEGLNSEKPSRIREAAQAVGRLISGFDGMFTAGTYAMVYDYQHKQALANGLAGREAEAFARNEAERITDEIAQPTRAGARSIVEVTQTNPAWRVLWAFGSEARKNLALAVYSTAKRTPAEAYRAWLFVAILNGLLGVAIRTAIRDLRDDEDEEIFEEKNWSWRRLGAMALSDPFYGFPIAGEVIERAIFTTLGVYKPQDGLLDIDRAIPAIKRGPETLEEIGQGEWHNAFRDTNAILSAMGQFNSTMAGAASLSNLAKDLFEIADNVTEKEN